MGSTANLAIPYPELTDTPDVPRDVSALAERVDAICAALGLGPGELRWYAGGDTPAGWLDCTGQAVARATYPELFAKIGTTYGAGDGVATFNVPDYRGRVPMGAGTGAGGGAAGTGAPSGGAALTARSRGAWGGRESHALSTTELASHAHGVSDPGHTHPGGAMTTGAGTYTTAPLLAPHNNNIAAAWDPGVHTTGVQVTAAGGNGAHPNDQPWTCARVLIRALPL